MSVNKKVKQLLRGGEDVSVECKRCLGKIENDMLESLCVFPNRFGGDLLLGADHHH